MEQPGISIPQSAPDQQAADNTRALIRISLFANARNPKPVGDLTLQEALARIRNGTYQQAIASARRILQSKGTKAYTKAKNALPAVTFAGLFSYRNNNSLIAHSGIVHGDIDHLADVDATKQRLIANPHVTYCFISPSGDGLKLGVSVPKVRDDAAYKEAWQQVADYFETRYQVVWDPSGKDIARLCFVSWDPALYLALDAQPFALSDQREWYAERARKTAVEIITTSTPGHLHEARLKASNLLGGYVAGGFLSYDMAYAVLEAAVRGHTDDVERSMKTIADGLAHGQQRPFSLSQLEAERAAWSASRSSNGQPSTVNGEPQDPQVDDVDDTSSSDDVLPPYVLRDGSLHYRKPDTILLQPLCNFMAWIREERTEDDGAERRRIVVLEATIQDDKCFPDLPMSITDFYNLTGLLKGLGTEAIVSPGPLVKDRIRHAIQLYSKRRGYAQRQVFTHLGWRKIDDVWCYLHAGGSIPAKVEVVVEKALERYHLPEVTSAEAAIAASLRVLECAPLRVTVPLLATAYLGPLAEWVKPDLTIWLEGPSGARKSSIAALMLCHYGMFDRVHPPDSWESTANELERLAFLAKDAVLWIDDYTPRPSAKDMHEQERKAQRLIRAQGNLSGRARMRADMTLRPAYYPRGVTLSTGELHPSGTSTFARMLQLDVDPSDVNLVALSTAQQESSLLAEAMAAYIQWLQPQLDTLVPSLKSRWLELRTAALSQLTHHTRHPEMFAHLVLAWELFLGFASDIGVLSDQDRQERRAAGLEAVIESINRQRFDAEAEDPAYRFCHLIREALIQGKAYLDDTQGWYPNDAGQWGWVLQTIQHRDGTTSEEWKPAPGASMLGWLDQDFLYLLPDASYRLAFENLQRAGMLLLPQQSLWKLLVQRGYAQRGRDRLTVVKNILGHSKRVLLVSRKKLEGGIPS